MGWFYLVNGVQHGPVNWQALVAMASMGQLKPTDMLWTEGQHDWQPASSFPNLVFANPSYNEELKWVLPVGRSGWAIAAGYLGLLSLIGIFAPFAIFAGILALRDIKKNPGRGGTGRAIFGIVMGALFTVLYGILIVAAMTPKPY